MAVAVALAFARTVSLHGLGVGLTILPVVIRVIAAPVFPTVLAGLGVGRIVLSLLAVVVGFTAILTIGLATDG